MAVTSKAFPELYVLERCIGVRFIVQLLDVFTKMEQVGYIYLVTERCGYDLLGYMNHRGVLVPAEMRCVIRALCNGLTYLHDVLKMAHADVKLANVIIGGGNW